MIVALPHPLPWAMAHQDGSGSGGTIGLWAPSGALPDPALTDRAVEHLQGLGYRVVRAPGLDARDGYFAGTSAQRLAALERLLADPAVDLILAARGGFGLSHLLPHIDWSACAGSRKLFCGFSDFTAFHLALYARTGQVSIAGPMASNDLGGPLVSDLHRTHVWQLMADGAHGHRYPAWTHDGPPFDAQLEGTLWGGNLCLLAHLVGTPWFPHIEQGLLYLEDIGEAPYRIERMLMQLELAGILERQQAILLGAFTQCESPSGAPVGYSMAEVVARLRERFRGPILTGLPFGHVRDKVALPFGAQGRLRVTGQSWTLQVAPFLAP